MRAPPFDYESALTSCAAGERTALQALYRQEAPLMLALCHRMLADTAEAQHVVRETFVLIWKNAASYDRQTPARAWMYSILRYRARQRLRHPGRSSGAFTEFSMPSPDATGTATAKVSLAHRLLCLDPIQRRSLLLAFYQGLSYPEIANRLQRPLADLKQHVRAALHQLMEIRRA